MINRQDIIAMAREAGATEWCPGWHLWTDDLERFAALIAAAAKAEERESCAKVCEDEDVAPTDDAVGVQQCIAAAIRARGETTSMGQT